LALINAYDMTRLGFIQLPLTRCGGLALFNTFNIAQLGFIQHLHHGIHGLALVNTFYLRATPCFWMASTPAFASTAEVQNAAATKDVHQAGFCF
jgi:hypothetical protein